MKKYVMVCLWTLFFGLNSYVYSGDVEVIVKDNTENSGFAVKEETTGDTIARFTGEGNVGIGTSTPRAKLEVNGDFIRKIDRVHGMGEPIVYFDENVLSFGPIDDRVLSFTKKYDTTGIRVTYTDYRSLEGPLSDFQPTAKWEIRFNGNSCPDPGPLFYRKDGRLGGVDNGAVADSATFVGTCFGLPAGTYTIEVYVTLFTSLPNFSISVVTGGEYWCLEAEEVW